MKKPFNLQLLYRSVAIAAGVGIAALSVAQSEQSSDNAQPAAAAARAKSSHWSYQPIETPPIPQVAHADWVNTPIDAFILAAQEKAGIAPSPAADKRALIRRVYLDVLGFIPTPEEADAFVADNSPDAYERLVDRVLSSPHFGERQARRWLDLARYADSAGFENDGDRRNMWRYRDYVIDAFNADKPFDRFIQEQIAGDELWPADSSAITATGFLAQYPDNNNSRDMVQRRYQIITDITDMVGEVVLGQTLECARCHDHKFDSISQKDYFAFQSFFANVAPVNVKVEPSTADEIAHQQAQQQWETATVAIRDRIKEVRYQDREDAWTYHKQRYLPDTRVALFKPEDEWNALDRWINHRFSQVSGDGALDTLLQDKALSTDPAFYSEWHAQRWAEVEALKKDLKQYDHLKPSIELGSTEISAMKDLSADSPPTYLLFGGDHERPLDEVQPAFPPAILDIAADIQPTDTSSGRRAALAQWLTNPDNPLTARVYANRVWTQYFSRGLVDTVSDFGKAGQDPSHPELLDYLAANFIDNAWSVKELHRGILLSSVYRQSSQERLELAQVDPENRLLAVFPHHRLEAEQIRDSLLVAAAKLNPEVGGPSVLPPLPGNAGGDNEDYDGNPAWPVSADPADHNRRSLYVFTRRSVPYPLLSVFNMASPQEPHSKRDVSTTPLQALALFNSELVYGWSGDLAQQVLNAARVSERDPIDLAYDALFARQPSAEERATLTAYLTEQQALISEHASRDELLASAPAGDSATLEQHLENAAFVELVHTLANSNEFVYQH